MTGTPSDLQATITETVADALAATLPTLLSQIVEQLTAGASRPAAQGEAPVDPEREQVVAAEAEKARWDAMPADELARAESAARVQRWVDARDDLTERKAPLDLLADIEADMSPQEIAEARKRP